MPKHLSLRSFRPSLPFLLLLSLLAILWIGGGSSRADELGQVVVRGMSALCIIILILLGERPEVDKAKPILILLVAAIVLVLLQLIPLPPSLWQSLPGRAIFKEAATLSGQPQPWRPLAIVPSATFNAAASLIVPAAVFLLATALKNEEKAWLPGILLALIAMGALLTLLQFSGAQFDNPLINDEAGDVSGVFANRNHLALFLAFGLLLAPVWAFLNGRDPGWRVGPAIGLLLLLSLTILASGSRAGAVVGLLALPIGLLIVKQAMARKLDRYPRWVFPTLISVIIGLILLFVLISFAADRAVSINRAITIDPAQDFRQLALPTLFDMIRTYFPLGYGFGGFDPIFRIHEPFALLDYTYFNHAHDDLLEIILEAGIPGLALLLAGILWWLFASIGAWRSGPSARNALPKLGSAILFLLLIASAFDYPARTPMIMAITIFAGLWLNDGTKERLPITH